MFRGFVIFLTPPLLYKNRLVRLVFFFLTFNRLSGQITGLRKMKGEK